MSFKNYPYSIINFLNTDTVSYHVGTLKNFPVFYQLCQRRDDVYTFYLMFINSCRNRTTN